MANVLLINPPQMYRVTQIASGVIPPIGAAYIATYPRKLGNNVQFIDPFRSGIDIFSKEGEAKLCGLTLPEIVDRIPDGLDVIGVTNLLSLSWSVVRKVTSLIKEKFPEIPIVTIGINQIPGISADKMARLRKWGYTNFFIISYLIRPWRLVSTVFHILRGVESTKVERISHAKLFRYSKASEHRVEKEKAY